MNTKLLASLAALLAGADDDDAVADDDRCPGCDVHRDAPKHRWGCKVFGSKQATQGIVR